MLMQATPITWESSLRRCIAILLLAIGLSIRLTVGLAVWLTHLRRWTRGVGRLPLSGPWRP